MSLVSSLIIGVFTFFQAVQVSVWTLSLGGLSTILAGVVVWSLLLTVVKIEEQLDRLEHGIVQTVQIETGRKPVESYSVLDRL